MKILVIDVGGTNVKLHLGKRTPIKIPSGPAMTPRQMVADIRKAAAEWQFDHVSMGYPGVVRHGKIAVEPWNLGRGWTRFDFEKAFGCPTRIVNDAAMQAFGSYNGGRMLFLGLGTGLGSALIVDGVLVPMELGHLPYRKGRSYEEYVGEAGRRRLGKAKWQKHVQEVVTLLRAALEPDEIVLGGGNVKKLETPPPNVRVVDNSNAVVGGMRLWQ